MENKHHLQLTNPVYDLILAVIGDRFQHTVRQRKSLLTGNTIVRGQEHRRQLCQMYVDPATKGDKQQRKLSEEQELSAHYGR